MLELFSVGSVLFSKIGELGLWYSLFKFAVGDGLYGTVVLGILVLLIALTWRLPDIGRIPFSRVTGRVALGLVVALVATFVLVMVLILYQREAPRMIPKPAPPTRPTW
ncbi:MAG: hypothetical protein OEV94_12010 [Deltaproteobacteria bacterium]|nr:hypothetical protein [Deltaproteobacteria bacterium]